VVILPLRLVTTLSRQTTAAMDVGLIAWALLTGAIVASACGAARSGPRTLAMAACLVLALILPGLAWCGASPSMTAEERGILSPILLMHALAEARGLHPSSAAWMYLGVVSAAAVLAWGAVGIAFAAGGGPRRAAAFVEPTGEGGG
jgi:hypothetical protein